MINFIENKPINWQLVQDLLEISRQKNHWTNFGPVSSLLEEEIRSQINLDNKLSVTVCSSGGSALHALVNLHTYLQKKELKWVVCSFGFPCTIQGPLQKAAVVDCDKNGMLDLSALQSLEYDGLIVTNIFGLQQSLKPWKDFCLQNNKLFLCDAATAYDTINHEENEIVSFHQTKPWGMGEGGCIIVKKEYAHTLSSILNFGLTTNEPVNRLGNNGKLSDFASAFIIQRLRQMPLLTPLYRNQYNRIVSLAESIGFKAFGKFGLGTPCNVPILSHKPIKNLQNKHVVLKKYYVPLADTPIAKYLYEHIVNIPCIPEMEQLKDNEILSVLENLC